MQKFVDKLTEWSEKLAQSFFLKTIVGGFIYFLPLSMIGSIAVLINNISLWNFQNFLASTGIGSALNAIYQFTVGLLAVYLAFSMAHSAAEQMGMKKEATSIGIVSLVAFFIMTPYEDGMLLTTWMGATGMFGAIVCAFLVAGIFKFCFKYNVAIRLPKQVPPMVANQFTAILPALFTTIIFGIIKIVMSFTPFGDLHNLVYSIVGMPLKYLGGNIFGAYVLFASCALLWFCGIHGGMIVMNIMMLVFMPLQMENLAAYQAGEPLPNMVCGQFISVGTGSLVFVFLLLILAKSETAKSVSRLAILPAFFGIDEPAYFGFPMIMNPIFLIPWVIISPLITVFGTYILNLTGLLPYASGASAGYNVPFFVSTFVSFGWKGGVWGFVFLAINAIVALPFVKAYDRSMLKREREMENEEV